MPGFQFLEPNSPAARLSVVSLRSGSLELRGSSQGVKLREHALRGGTCCSNPYKGGGINHGPGRICNR